MKKISLFSKHLLCALSTVTLFSGPVAAMEGNMRVEITGASNPHVIINLQQEREPVKSEPLPLKELERMAEENYAANFLSYRTNAINYADTLPTPELSGSEGLLGVLLKGGDNKMGWEFAKGNYRQMMHIFKINEADWPVRGWVKKYNLHLIEVTNRNIEDQKQDFVKTLQTSQ